MISSEDTACAGLMKGRASDRMNGQTHRNVVAGTSIPEAEMRRDKSCDKHLLTVSDESCLKVIAFLAIVRFIISGGRG